MLTDLEITKACARAMGLRTLEGTHSQPHLGRDYQGNWPHVLADKPGTSRVYDPLHDDAQAMALVKRFELVLYPPALYAKGVWRVIAENALREEHANLNQAICETVAQLHLASANASNARGEG